MLRALLLNLVVELGSENFVSLSAKKHSKQFEAQLSVREIVVVV